MMSSVDGRGVGAARAKGVRRARVRNLNCMVDELWRNVRMSELEMDWLIGGRCY